jgi:hypothetical protein
MYVKANKLKLGAQFGYDAWSGYVNEARPESFSNTFSMSAGLEFIPDFIFVQQLPEKGPLPYRRLLLVKIRDK